MPEEPYILFFPSGLCLCFFACRSRVIILTIVIPRYLFLGNPFSGLWGNLSPCVDGDSGASEMHMRAVNFEETRRLSS